MLGSFAVVVVAGARQVGKSTLLHHELPDWDSVVFDPAVDVGNARKDPELFLDNHPPPLVLDEIQYAPELAGAVKRRVDLDKKPGMYVLTGSQQWAVLKAVSESLAGRAAFLDMEGFCLSELAGAPEEEHWLKRYLDDPAKFVTAPPARLPAPRTVHEQLWYGFLPETDSLDAGLVGEFHRAYLRTYVERDARIVSNVQDWQQFGRFVRLAAALTAQEINHSQLGRELGVTPQTAQRWLGTLRATFQWFEVPAYHGNAVKRVSGKPKGYIADTGLACSLHMLSSPRALDGNPLAGALFETAAVGEIRKLAAAMTSPPILHHWRSSGGAEVDLLLERDGVFHPLEFKLASQPARRDARGIASFREAHPELKVAPGLVISPTPAFAQVSDLDYALPWDSR
jgi:hypothetical protein